MADSVFDPGGGMAGLVPNFDQLSGNINTFLGNPRVQGALLSTGLALMQPPSFGDNATSQIGRAIGAGGESLRIGDAQDLAERKQRVAEQEAGSKGDLREAQAAAAGARSDAAASRATAATDRLEFQKRTQESNERLKSLALQIQLSKAFQTYKAAQEKQNASDALMNPGKAPTPVLGFNDWVATNPHIKDILAGQQSGAGVVGGDTSVTDNGAGGPPPRNPADRRPNIPYVDAKGGTVYWDDKQQQFYRR